MLIVTHVHFAKSIRSNSITENHILKISIQSRINCRSFLVTQLDITRTRVLYCHLRTTFWPVFSSTKKTKEIRNERGLTHQRPMTRYYVFSYTVEAKKNSFRGIKTSVKNTKKSTLFSAWRLSRKSPAVNVFVREQVVDYDDVKGNQGERK